MTILTIFFKHTRRSAYVRLKFSANLFWIKWIRFLKKSANPSQWHQWWWCFSISLSVCSWWSAHRDSLLRLKWKYFRRRNNQIMWMSSNLRRRKTIKVSASQRYWTKWKSYPSLRNHCKLKLHIRGVKSRRLRDWRWRIQGFKWLPKRKYNSAAFTSLE